MVQRKWIPYLLISAIGALLFFPFLGKVHLFDWDEANFAEAAREMLVTENFLRVYINYLPFWEKPPVFIWMQALSMKLFGINEFAARFPNAVIGIMTLCALYYWGKRIVNENAARWWVGFYIASWLPHFYFKTAIIDPTFNLFIFLAVTQVYAIEAYQKKWRHALLAGVFLGLAVLTKGPAAFLIAGLALVVFLIWNKGFKGYPLKYLLGVGITSLVVTFLWFGIDIVQNGWWFTTEFIRYQIRLFTTPDAGHGGPFFYHFIVLLIGCFPAAAFLFQSGKSDKSQSVKIADGNNYLKWMWVLLGVTLILFSIVKTKIVHYSSLCYFPLTFIAAWQASKISLGELIKKRVVILLFITGGLLAVAITLLPLVGIYKEQLIPYFDDPFAVANLNADVSWSYWEMAIGAVYLSILIVFVFRLRKAFTQNLYRVFALQALVIFITLVHFVPKVEAYSQRAAIEFYKSFQNQEAYVVPVGFKSYAYLFYSEKALPPNPEVDYVGGVVDKPVFFITKNIHADELEAGGNVERIGEKNGYVFFRRIN